MGEENLKNVAGGFIFCGIMRCSFFRDNDGLFIWNVYPWIGPGTETLQCVPYRGVIPSASVPLPTAQR